MEAINEEKKTIKLTEDLHQKVKILSVKRKESLEATFHILVEHGLFRLKHEVSENEN